MSESKLISVRTQTYSNKKKRVRCYKCKEFENEDFVQKFHLKHNGHTRQIWICDSCLGVIVTSYFKGG